MAAELVADGVMPERGLSQVERVVDTFVAPSKTFTDILRNASWWLPFVLLLICSVATAVTVDKQVGFDRVYQNVLAQSPKAEDKINAMEPAQKAQMMKFGTMQMKASAYGGAVFVTLFLLFYSVCLWAAFNFGLGAHTKYGQVLAVSFYAALPYVLISLISILTIKFGGNADAYDMKNPVGTNPAYYLTDAPAIVKGLLSSLDVIKLWSVVLQVIGMAIIARKTIAQSALIVGGFWLVGVLVVVGFVAIS